MWHFLFIGIERNVCRCTFKGQSVMTQFAKLAAGEQLCLRCTHSEVQLFKTFKSFSRKMSANERYHIALNSILTVPFQLSSSSVDSTTLGGSWSVQQFYSTPVYPRPSPSNQQFSSYKSKNSQLLAPVSIVFRHTILKHIHTH